MKYLFCAILTAIVAFYTAILLKIPNYKKCDRNILLYDKKQSLDIRVSTPTERKCSYNFFLAMKLRSFFLKDSNSSFYIATSLFIKCPQNLTVINTIGSIYRQHKAMQKLKRNF